MECDFILEEAKKPNWLLIGAAVIIVVIIGVVAIFANGDGINLGQREQFNIYKGENGTNVVAIENTGMTKKNVSILLNDEYECIIDRFPKGKTKLINIHECPHIEHGNLYTGSLKGIEFVVIEWANKSEEHELEE